jgi:site-specific DNA-methyltransferase (adenine-specific)
MKQIKLMQGDNMKSLDLLPDNSIDSVVTDPPYALNFMNKKWDSEVPSVEFWKKVYQKLKPGGHILSFGGTRTYHRMVVNMEDAGFEIRDQIMWIYGSGFPKSLNIGKAFDKKSGNEREVVGSNKKQDFNENNGSMMSKENYKSGEVKYTDIDITKGSSQYEGWGTALKPANEPICLARKPLSEKTIVDNVIKWGTGGINVDGCRIETDDKLSIHKGNLFNGNSGIETNDSFISSGQEGGRFPANILFDEEAAQVLDEQTGVLKGDSPNRGPRKGGGIPNFIDQENKRLGIVKENNTLTPNKFSGDGGASRFFYVAKVSKKERNLGLDNFEDKEENIPCSGKGGPDVRVNNRGEVRGKVVTKNNHPTLKPINLMTYLCRLITPPGGIVLDPFMGSGSTGISACLEGFRFVGMELDEDYFKIAEARINNFEEYRKLLK